jgi:hypothetical protein
MPEKLIHTAVLFICSPCALVNRFHKYHKSARLAALTCAIVHTQKQDEGVQRVIQ